ncbi:hypothetical protein COD89_14055 [Bacillus thuringiensis]|nr:hypothetical protein CON12_01975 [Bacillus thuringiensis]PGV58753.1 hypothetical protein COD89_14055 [Bacillus thuringiensis]
MHLRAIRDRTTFYRRIFFTILGESTHFFTILEFTMRDGGLMKVKLRNDLYIYLVSYFET